MKAWKMQGGDLVLGAGGFQTITGAERLVQGLRVALGEPLGVDRFHPGWGSLLDQFVGAPLDEGTVFDLEQEIHRVVGNYSAVQREKAARDALRNDGRSRYTRSDVIASVGNIEVTARNDSASVLITIVTGAGEQVTQNFEVNQSG